MQAVTFAGNALPPALHNADFPPSGPRVNITSSKRQHLDLFVKFLPNPLVTLSLYIILFPSSITHAMSLSPGLVHASTHRDFQRPGAVAALLTLALLCQYECLEHGKNSIFVA